MARTSRNNMKNSSFFHIMVQGINQEYIHNNPVKAGICKNMEEYPFSSYSGIYQANQIELQKKIQKIVSQCMIKKEEKYLKEMVRILKFENNISYRVIEKSLNLNREKLRKLIII